MNVGKSMKVLQSKLDISNNKLADDLGVTKEHISRLRGQKFVSGENLIALSDYFGLAVWEFIKVGEE